jgi:transposase-like protein
MGHRPAGDGGESNGRKGVATDTGRIASEAPRGRHASFDPQPIAKRQRRFPGFDDKVVPVSARGMGARENAEHLRDLHGMEVSPGLASAAAGAVLDEVAAWRARRWGRSTRWCSSTRSGSRSATRARSGTGRPTPRSASRRAGARRSAARG